LLSYKGDVGLAAKLVEWERFYYFARPVAFSGKTPYEALREKLQSIYKMSHEYPQFTKNPAKLGFALPPTS